MSKPNPKLKSRKEEPAKTTEAAVEGSVAKVETPEKKNLFKERTPEEKRKGHRDGIVKTIVAGALGIIAGFSCFSLYGTGEDRIWYVMLMIVIGFTYLIQKLIYPQLKIDTKEFKLKDWFFVEFIVVDFFLIIWTLLLN